ncbi:MAG TPA: hypothetical protein VGB70_05635 [Allosphingosinicella sp.]|jgi:hypothetical protein
MIKSLALAALLAAPSVAQAQQCFTKQQVADTAITLVPYAIDSLRERCLPHLPQEAFLSKGGGDLVTRIRSDGAGREQAAGAVMQKLMGADVPPMKDTTTLTSFFGQMVGAMIAKDVKPELCPGISGMIEALAPLPTDNLATFFVSGAMLVEAGTAAEKGKKKARKPDDFEICKDG